LGRGQAPGRVTSDDDEEDKQLQLWALSLRESTRLEPGKEEVSSFSPPSYLSLTLLARSP